MQTNNVTIMSYLRRPFNREDNPFQKNIGSQKEIRLERIPDDADGERRNEISRSAVATDFRNVQKSEAPASRLMIQRHLLARVWIAVWVLA